MTTTAHASCIAIGDHAILIQGPSGGGKSDLALRMVDEGAVLVSDDYVALEDVDGTVVAAPPPNIEGLLEVRGLGLLTLPFATNLPVILVVDLVDREDVPRLPNPDESNIELLPGIEVPLLRLSPFDASTPAKLRLAARALLDGIMRTSL